MKLALLLLLFAACSVRAAPPLVPGSVVEFQVSIPDELRDFDRSGLLMTARVVRIAVAVPIDFDPSQEWPVLLVSAGSSSTAYSNRRLFDQYKQPALVAGWIVVATDPSPEIKQWEDNVSLRFVEALIALDSLHDAWSNAGKAQIAFAGTGGGAKFSGWLAAMFASQHSNVIGVFQAGVEDEALINAAMQFQVLTDVSYLSVPIFMFDAAGADSTSAAHLRTVQSKLHRFGYRNVEIGLSEGSEPSGALSLRDALVWYRTLTGPSVAR